MIQVKSNAYLALKSIAGCHGIRNCNLRNIVITVCTILKPTIDMFEVSRLRVSLAEATPRYLRAHGLKYMLCFLLKSNLV